MESNILDEDYINRPLIHIASFWRRFFALMIDWILLAICVKLLSVLLSFSIYSMIITVVTILYKPTLEYLLGATIGKIALGIKIVTTKNESPSIYAILLRNCIALANHIYSFFIPFMFLNIDLPITAIVTGFDFDNYFPNVYAIIFPVIYAVDVIVFVIDPNSQSLHDKLGGTLVIIKNKKEL